jgi:hypothetical protein
MEVDAVVARLLPAFELTKLAALDGREKYCSLVANRHVDQTATAEAHRSWQRLEATCVGILHRIDQLVARSLPLAAAVRVTGSHWRPVSLNWGAPTASHRHSGIWPPA